MIRVLFVCLGNICRSPLAEGIFQNLVDKAGLRQQVSSDSCATSTYHIGEKAHQLSRKVAQDNGIQLTSRSRQLVPKDFKEFDYIIAMDASNKRNIQRVSGFEATADKVYLMREFDTEKSGKDVMDTYGGDLGDFEECYQVLHECCTNLVREIKNNRL